MGGDGEHSDEALLAAARQGDRPALEALLERYQARIYRYGLRMCGDREDAKDVLQDTMLAMARRVGGLQAVGALPTWLYTVARSFCIKRRRGVRTVARPLDEVAPAALADPARGPEERVADRQLETALAAAITGLSPPQRDVLVLRDVEGLSAPQVAAVLGIGVEAVKSRLHRARIALRDRLAPALDLPPAEPAAAGCPDVLTLWSRHREGEITADLCAQMEAHLAACPRCTAACDSLRRALAVCQSAPTPRVPAEVQRALRAALDATA